MGTQTLKNRILPENRAFEGDPEPVVAATINHPSNGGCHKGVGNLEPAGACFGRGETIPAERRRIKHQTIQNRRLSHQRQATQPETDVPAPAAKTSMAAPDHAMADRTGCLSDTSDHQIIEQPAATWRRTGRACDERTRVQGRASLQKQNTMAQKFCSAAIRISVRLIRMGDLVGFSGNIGAGRVQVRADADDHRCDLVACHADRQGGSDLCGLYAWKLRLGCRALARIGRQDQDGLPLEFALACLGAIVAGLAWLALMAGWFFVLGLTLLVIGTLAAFVLPANILLQRDANSPRV